MVQRSTFIFNFFLTPKRHYTNEESGFLPSIVMMLLTVSENILCLSKTKTNKSCID